MHTVITVIIYSDRGTERHVVTCINESDVAHETSTHTVGSDPEAGLEAARFVTNALAGLQYRDH